MLRNARVKKHTVVRRTHSVAKRMYIIFKPFSGRIMTLGFTDRHRRYIIARELPQRGRGLGKMTGWEKLPFLTEIAVYLGNGIK